MCEQVLVRQHWLCLEKSTAPASPKLPSISYEITKKPSE